MKHTLSRSTRNQTPLYNLYGQYLKNDSANLPEISNIHVSPSTDICFLKLKNQPAVRKIDTKFTDNQYRLWDHIRQQNGLCSHQYSVII